MERSIVEIIAGPLSAGACLAAMLVGMVALVRALGGLRRYESGLEVHDQHLCPKCLCMGRPEAVCRGCGGRLPRWQLASLSPEAAGGRQMPESGHELCSQCRGIVRNAAHPDQPGYFFRCGECRVELNADSLGRDCTIVGTLLEEDYEAPRETAKSRPALAVHEAEAPQQLAGAVDAGLRRTGGGPRTRVTIPTCVEAALPTPPLARGLRATFATIELPSARKHAYG